ncbi:MAG: hypothetical protein V4648_09155 [Bacteroidota bacterium]
MKKILTPLFLLFSILSFSQTVESLKLTTNKMYEALYNMAYDDVLDLTYPKVFDITNREQLHETLDASFENRTLRKRYVMVHPTFTYSSIKKMDEKSIGIVNYTNVTRLFYEEKLTPLQVSEIKKTLTESGRYKTIRFESARNCFYTESNIKMIAIADASTQNEWKFLNYEQVQYDVAKTVLGEASMKKLGL